MKILSIDWDYFYPDSTSYDWGAREEEFFLLPIWYLRVGDVNLITQVPILKEYMPKVPKDFWSRVVSNKPNLYVAESHSSIASLIVRGSIVTNLDAHHDFGYHDYESVTCCENWAKMSKDSGLIRQYHLIYPSWRKGKDESENFAKVKEEITSISYTLPAKQDYDIIFICRSGAWTPPWHDKKFFDFANAAPRQGSLYSVLPRPFDLKKAIREEKIMHQKMMGMLVHGGT